MIRPSVLGLWLLLSALAPTHADFASGMAAYNAGEYGVALNEWLPLAEQGSVASQFNVALIYDGGKGLDADPAQAAKWYESAAEGGVARAQFRLAELFEAGDAVKQDYGRAFQWFFLAEEQKHPGARKRRKSVASKMTPSQIALGRMYAREWNRKRKESAKRD